MSPKNTLLRVAVVTAGMVVTGPFTCSPSRAGVVSAPERAVASVVLIDTHVPSKAYDPKYAREGLTNAHFFDELIRKDSLLTRRVRATVQVVGREGLPDQIALRASKPDVIIIHRSAFHRLEDDGVAETILRPKLDERLRMFIISFAESGTRFLVYSRTPGTRQYLERLMAEDARLKGRLTHCQFRPGNPLRDQSQMRDFSDRVAGVIDR